MSVTSLILFLCGFANFCLFGFVLWRRHTRPSHFVLSTVVLMVAFWNVSVATISLTSDVAVLTWAGRAAFVFGELGCMAFLVFTWMFPETPHPRPLRMRMAIMVGLGLVVAGLSLTSLVQAGIEVGPSVKRPVLGPLHPFYALYAVTAFGWSTWNLFASRIRTPGGRERQQLDYTLSGWAMAFVIVTASHFVLPHLVTGNEVWFIGGALSTLFCMGMTSYAMVRYRLMDLGIAFRSVAIMGIMTAAVGFIFFLLLLLNTVLAEHMTTTAKLVVALAFALFIAVIIPPFQRQITQFVDQRLFRGRYDHQAALVRFGDSLMRTHGRENIAGLTAHEIPIILQAEGACVYLPEEGGERFLLFAWSGREEPDYPEALANSDPLVRAVLAKGGGITVDDVTSAPHLLPTSRETLAVFRQLNAAVAVPLLCQSRVLGLAFLGEKRKDDVFTTDDLRLFGALAAQAAFALDNTRLYEQVLASKKHYETILHHMQRGVLAVGTDGRIVTLNDMACVILGVQGPEWEGRTAVSLAPPLAELIKTTLEDQADQPATEFALPLAKGAIPCECETSVLFDARNRVIGALAVFQDLTEKKRFQEQVRRMDRLASVGTLAAGLAHEIKNPLVSIQTFAQLLPERYQDAHFRDGFGQVVRGEIDRINRLLQNLLEFSRPRPCRIDAVAVHDLVERALTLLENEVKKRGIQVVRRCGRDVPVISGDAEQLYQVVFNLLQNAMQAMDRTEKAIIISTAGATLEDAAGRQPGVELRISDTGHGIDEKDLPRIFDPFYTTKANGSGLGLSICHSIVEEHGGSMHVESRLDHGTTFTLLLPVRARIMENRLTPTEQVDGHGKSARAGNGKVAA